MIEITAIRLWEDQSVKWFEGKWESSAPCIMSSFNLDGCPPFKGWLYGGEATMTTKNLGGMDGDFITTGSASKLRA